MGRKGRYDEKPKRGKGKASKKQKDPEFKHIFAADDSNADVKSSLKKRYDLIQIFELITNRYRRKNIDKANDSEVKSEKKVKFNETVEYSHVSDEEVVNSFAPEDSDSDDKPLNGIHDESDPDSDDQPMNDEFNEVFIKVCNSLF